jgi:hypothetical protein
MNEAGEGERLASLFRPSRIAWWIVGLGLIGAALSLVVPAYRPALLPFLVAFILIAVSAMLVGDVPRYRYPVDPLMYVLAAGGLTGLVSVILGLVRRRADLAPGASPAFSPHPPPPSPLRGRGGA